MIRRKVLCKWAQKIHEIILSVSKICSTRTKKPGETDFFQKLWWWFLIQRYEYCMYTHKFRYIKDISFTGLENWNHVLNFENSWCQKVPKSNFQSVKNVKNQKSSKSFSIFFSLKNTNLGAYFFHCYLLIISFLKSHYH